MYKIPDDNTPPYWIRPQQILSGKKGAHRFIWDLHYNPLPVTPGFAIAATYMNTAPNASSPWVMPGKYLVTLTGTLADIGLSYTDTIEIRMDPRVKTSNADLIKLQDATTLAYRGRINCVEYQKLVHAYRAQLQSQLTNASITVANRLGPFEKEAGQLENTATGKTDPSFGRLANLFAGIFNLLEDCDNPPTSQVSAALTDALQQLETLKKQWDVLKNKL